MGIATPAELALHAEVRQLRERIAELENERQAALQQAEERDRRLRAVQDMPSTAGAAAHESTTRLGAALASMSDAVFIADAQGRLIHTNDAFVTYHRFRNREECSKKIEDCPKLLTAFLPDGSVAPVDMWAMPRALRGETAKNFEYTLRRNDTSETWVGRYSFAPIRGDDGAIVGAVVVARDVTEQRRAEEHVSRSQRTFSELLERAPFGIYVVDSQFRIAHMNASGQDGAFRNVRPLIGRPINEAMRILWPEPVAAEIISHFRHTLETGEPYYSTPFFNPRNDVEAVEGYEWELHRMMLPDGQYGVICYYFDSTRLRQAETALRESEVRLRRIAQAGHIGFFEWNASKDTAYWSPEHYELFGLEPGSPVSWERWLECVYPEDRPRVLENAARLQERARSEGQVRSHKDEYRIIRPDGSVAWLESDLSVEMVREDAIIRGSVRDITERRQVEEALRASEARLRQLADSMPQLVWVADDDGNIDYYTKAGAYGVTGTTAEGRWLWTELIHPDDLETTWAAWRAAGAQGSYECEHRVRSADGSYRWHLSRARRVVTGGGPNLWYGSSTDVDDFKKAATALRESEERFRVAQELSPDGFLIFRPLRDDAGAVTDFLWIYENDAAARMNDTDPKEVRGKRVSEVLPHHDKSPFHKAYKEVAEAGDVRVVEESFYDQDTFRQRRWFRVVAVPTSGGDVAVVVQDKTESKRAEEALAAAQRQIQGIIDNTPAIVYAFDLEERFVLANSALAELLNSTPQKMIGKRRHEFMPKEDADWHEANDRQAILAGSALEFEEYSQLKGRSITWLTTKFPLRDAQGRINAVAGISADISERKKAESELKKQAELLRLCFDPMIVWRLDGGIEMWNLGAERLYGYSEHEARRRGITELLATVFPKPWPGILTGLRTTGSWEGELRHRTRDGREVMVSTRLQLIEGSDRIERVLEVNRDITEKKQAEEQLRQAQKLESLGLLAGGVAHDFNNLLVGVIGNASLAQEMLPPDHPAAELLAGVLKTGEQAAHLTRQMLAYSGKGKFLVEPLNLSALVPDMCGLVRPSISKKIALRLDLEEDLPQVEGDRGQVQQVFMNLAINAAEAIGSYEGLITVRTGVQEVDEPYIRLHPELGALAPGKYVCLEVRDTGSGMDEATKAKIFDPFFSTKFTGRGLGLAAVSGILRGHKSGITVSSAPGEGSCFTVLFPATTPRAAGRSPVAGRDASLQGAGTVLVVDDEQVVRELAKRALERQGYTVLMADGGASAIDVFKRHPGEISLVVLDLSMPHMSGEEALPALGDAQNRPMRDV